MEDQTSAPPHDGATEEVRPGDMLPDGEYAIVEVLGHRTMVGRISEVERFGTKLLGIEPIFDGALLPIVLVGGSSIYQMTSVPRATAARRAPSKRYQLNSSVAAMLPPEPEDTPRLSWLDREDELGDTY